MQTPGMQNMPAGHLYVRKEECTLVSGSNGGLFDEIRQNYSFNFRHIVLRLIPSRFAAFD